MHAGIKRLLDSPTLTTWANLLVNLGGVAIVLPLVLTRLTTEEIALFLLFSTISGFQFIFTFGFTPTISRLFAYGLGGMSVERLRNLVRIETTESMASEKEADWATIEAVASISRRIYSLMGLIALAGFGIAGSLSIIKPVNALETPVTGWMAWGIVLITLVTSVRMTIYNAYLNGIGHVALVSRWSALFGTLNVFSSVLVVLLGGRLLELILVRQSWNIIIALKNWSLARNVETGRWTDFQNIPDKQILDVTWKSAWRSGLGHLFGYGTTNGLGIVYASIASSAQLASFLLGLRLLQTVSGLAQPPFYSKLPFLQRTFAASNRKEFNRLARRGMFLAYWAFAIPFALLILAGEPLLGLIRSNADLPSTAVLSVLGMAFFLERMGGMHTQLYSVTNHIIWHWANLGYGIIVLVSVVPLFKVFDTLGLAVALLMGHVFFLLPFILSYSKKVLPSGVISFEKMLAFPALVFMTSIVLIAYAF